MNLANNPFRPGTAAGAAAGGGPGGADEDAMIDGPSIPIEELISLVRHSKLATIKDALDYLPNKKFDKSLVQVGGCPCSILLQFILQPILIFIISLHRSTMWWTLALCIYPATTGCPST